MQYKEIQLRKGSENYKLKCVLCGQEVHYFRAYLVELDKDYEYRDDWLIECPTCDNWEQVGNNKPDSFQVL